MTHQPGSTSSLDWRLNREGIDFALSQPTLNQEDRDRLEPLLHDPNVPDANKEFIAIRLFAEDSQRILEELSLSVTKNFDATSLAKLAEAQQLIARGELTLDNVTDYLHPGNRKKRRKAAKLQGKFFGDTVLEN